MATSTPDNFKSQLYNQLIRFEPGYELPEGGAVSSTYRDYAAGAGGRLITEAQAAARIGVDPKQFSSLMTGAMSTNDPYGAIPQSVGIYPQSSGGGLFGFISSALDSVGSAVGKIGDFVSTTITNVMENPLPTIATIALTAMGVPAPIANGLVTAATGGSLEDVALSIGAGYAGGMIGEYVGGALDPTTGLAMGDLYVPDTTKEFYQNILVNVSDKASTAALQGKDFDEIVAAGVSGAVSSVLSNTMSKEIDPDADTLRSADVIGRQAANSILDGQNPTNVLASAADDYIDRYLTSVDIDDTDVFSTLANTAVQGMQQNFPTVFANTEMFPGVSLDPYGFGQFPFSGRFADEFAQPAADFMGPRLPTRAMTRDLFYTPPELQIPEYLQFNTSGALGGQTQVYADDSSLTMRDDGSMVVTDTAGQSTVYSADGSTSTDTGPAITRETVLDTATQPGAATNELVDTGPVITRETVLDTGAQQVVPGAATNATVDTGPAITREIVDAQQPAGLASLGDTQVYADGSSLTTRPDGSMVVTDIDGNTSIVSNIETGEVPITRTLTLDQTDVSTTQTLADGSTRQVYKDGSTLFTDPDGNMTATDATIIDGGGGVDGGGGDGGNGLGSGGDGDSGGGGGDFDDGLGNLGDGNLGDGDLGDGGDGGDNGDLGDGDGDGGDGGDGDGDGDGGDEGGGSGDSGDGDDSGDLDENTLRKLVGDDTIVGGVWGDEGGGSGDSGDGSGGLGDGDGGGGGDGGDGGGGDESGDKSLTDKVLDYVKENPLTTALLATTLVSGLAGGGDEEQTQETTSTPVKKTYTYGAPGEIKQTGLQQLFDASKSIYTPYTVPAQQQQQIQVQQPNMGPLLSGQAPGGYGLGSLTKQVGAGQAIDISQLTPEQLYQLQSMLGPGV